MEMKKNWALIGIFIFLAISLHAQKPKIQVTFQVVSGTPFAEVYGPILPQIQVEGLKILIDSLNHYLPFLDFTRESSSNKFSIKLDASAGISSTKHFVLLLSLKTSTWSSDPGICPFLTATRFSILGDDLSSVLTDLKVRWSEYLIANYDKVLVQTMFLKIPIKLGAEYYYKLDDNIYDLIIPYKKEDINLSTDDSKFKVDINYKVQNTTRKITQENLNVSGDVIDYPEAPAMNGCIRIALDQVGANKFTSGIVYFQRYGRYIYPTLHNEL